MTQIGPSGGLVPGRMRVACLTLNFPGVYAPARRRDPCTRTVEPEHTNPGSSGPKTRCRQAFRLAIKYAPWPSGTLLVQAQPPCQGFIPLRRLGG